MRGWPYNRELIWTFWDSLGLLLKGVKPTKYHRQKAFGKGRRVGDTFKGEYKSSLIANARATRLNLRPVGASKSTKEKKNARVQHS